MKAVHGQGDEGAGTGRRVLQLPDQRAAAYADLDRTKAQQLGVDVQDVFDTMQIYLGSLYINDFNKFGRTYQVIAQADAPFRSKPRTTSCKLKTRNTTGEMVPLSARSSR
jgi:multidrug efflux pump subunit AcrB